MPTLRCCLYVRMSTSRQISSPDRQRQLFAEYCAKWGLAPAGEFADEATSATDNAPQDRPGWRACVAAARRKAFDLLWCEERSRIARRPEDWFVSRATLGRYGVAIVTLASDPTAEHDTAIAEFSEGLFALLDRYKVAQMGEQISRAQYVSVSGGRYRGGYLPPGLGWVWDDRAARIGHYVLDERTQPLAVRAFELFARTRCYQQTAKALNAEGYTSSTGKQLSQPAARSILRNSVYRGGRRFGGEVYPTDLPEIVPQALVAQVDAILREQSHRPQRATHDHTARAIFAGLLRCPSCGAWLAVKYNTNSAGKTYLAYHCNHSRTVPITCGWRTLVPELTFERELLPVITAHLKERARHIRRVSESNRQQAQAKRQRERLEEERERILRQHQQGWIDDEAAADKLDGVRSRLAGLADATEEEAPVSAATVRAVLAAVEKEWGSLRPAEKRTLLQTVVDHIIPTPGDWPASAVQWRE